MKPFPAVYLFVVALVASFAALAQYPGGRTDLIVPGAQPSDLRRVTALTFARTLGELSGTRISVLPYPYGYFKGAVSSRMFSAEDGSQLALTSVDSVRPLPDFLSEATIVALLGRVDFALFVRDESDITMLHDFATLNIGEPLVVGAQRSAARFAARRTFEILGVPVTYIHYKSNSEARRALASGGLDVLIDVASLSRHPFKPLAAFAPVPVASVPTARGQGIDIVASRDYVLVAPPRLDHEVYEKINRDLQIVLQDFSFRDDLPKLGLREDYVEGRVYVAQQQEIGNDFCAICDCDYFDCKKDCPKCR